MSIRKLQPALFVASAVLLLTALAGVSFAATLANSTPAAVSQANSLGPESTSKVINLTLWMQVRNQAALDDLTKQIYTKGSANYHKFLTLQQYKEQFGASDHQLQVVKDFATNHGLEVVSTSRSNLAVQVRGTVGQVQNAFHVQINRYNKQGQEFRAAVGAPSVDGEAGAYVAAITGLDNLGRRPNKVHPVDPNTGKAYPYHQMTAAEKAQRAPSVMTRKAVANGGSNQYFEEFCWKGVETHGFTTNNNLPAAVYTGNRFGSEPGSQPPHLPPCGYEPYAALAAYQMFPLFEAGFGGQGQTLVIVDAFDWPSLTTDLELFSAAFGLPAPNLTIYQPQGPPAYNEGWAEEQSLDLQWGHTMAPFANIALVQSIDNEDVNLDNAVLYAIEAGLGNVISNSYGAPEALVDPATLRAENAIYELGALLGISVNFSSGDSGDFVASDGVKTVGTGADSPWATGVGGVSVFLNSDESIEFQTGWGTQLTRLATSSNTPVIPPLHQGFIYGGGGGTSGFFPKPWFQGGLGGSHRRVPDVALIGDPYTGVAIVFSPCGDTNSCASLGTIGGTSVACPMFSGLWTDVNQVTEAFAGLPAGQAAPFAYFVPNGSLYDVTSFSTPTNVAGSIFTGGTPIYEDPKLLMTPLDGAAKFPTAFYHSFTSYRWYDMGFGLDSSLHATPGWDNVTGNGTPNGVYFVEGVLSIF